MSKLQFDQLKMISQLESTIAEQKRTILDMEASHIKLMLAVEQTLNENGHLADGDVCTLRILRDSYDESKSSTSECTARFVADWVRENWPVVDELEKSLTILGSPIRHYEAGTKLYAIPDKEQLK